MFPVKDALLYVERHPLGGPRKGFQGDAFYTAENPPYGAVFTAYMKEKIKTKKEKRQEAEKDAAKKNQTLPYPTNDELRAEAEEAKPEVYFVVYDESGARDPARGWRVRRRGFSGWRGICGIRRRRCKKHSEEGEEDFPDAADQGPLVLPGTYSVRHVPESGWRSDGIGGPQSFKVVTEGAAADERRGPHGAGRVSAKGGAAVSRSVGALHTAEDVESRLKTIREALRETPAGEKQLEARRRWDRAARSRDSARVAGDVEMAKRSEPVPSSISERVNSVMEGERFSLAKPTQSHIDSYNIAAAEFGGATWEIRCAGRG